MRREVQKNDDNRRIKTFLILVSLIFSIFIFRLFYLQIIKGEDYLEQSTKNSLKSNVLSTQRGKIYDINGKVLATNKTAYELIYLDAKNLTKTEYDILKLSIDENIDIKDILRGKDISSKTKANIEKIYEDILEMNEISNIDKSEILQILYTTKPVGSNKKIIIQEDMSIENAMKYVEINKNDRIEIVEYDKRYYPNKEIASHIVGNVKLINDKEYEELKSKGYGNDEIIGKKGIEKQYDSILRGVFGKEYVEVDARGNVIDRISEIEPEQGANIYLSIDFELQKYMTEIFQNKYGVFIAMNAKTGKILTMVSSPEIDLNLLSSKISNSVWNTLLNSKETPLVNKAIAGLFPPGSTFKVVSGAAILDGGIKTTDSIYSTGSFTYAKTTFKDSHREGHGTTNFYKSIEESVNTYYYKYILDINRDRFFEIAREFGISKKTGIDIPNELSGVLPTPEWKKNKFKTKATQVWLPGDLINMSIGQGYLLTTPIQILSVYQTIANNGVRLVPQLVEKIDYKNDIIETKPIISNTIDLSEEIIKDLQKALTLPVKGKNGTAKILNLPFVNISAKTGTAQNSGKNDHSWLAGYFPSENPEIVFVALVQEGGYGGVAAGQKVRDFVYKYYEIYHYDEVEKYLKK